MRFIKCEVCNAEISDEKCPFAEYKRVIDGEVHCLAVNNMLTSLKRRFEKSILKMALEIYP
jgi:hypothetical protein